MISRRARLAESGRYPFKVQSGVRLPGTLSHMIEIHADKAAMARNATLHPGRKPEPAVIVKYVGGDVVKTNSVTIHGPATVVAVNGGRGVILKTEAEVSY